MGAAEQAAPLRALGVGEILDASVKIFRRHFKTLALCVIVVALPLGAIANLLQLSADPDAFDFEAAFDTSAEPAQFDATAVGAYAVSGLLNLVLFGLTTAACFRAVGAAYLGAPTTWRESLAFAGRRLHSVLWVFFLLLVVVVVGFVLCILPGIWLGVALSFAIPALLFEDLRGPAALRRSFRLVRHRWWPTFGVLLVGTILVTIVQTIVTIIVGISLVIAPDNFVLVLVVSTLVTVVGYVFSLPIQAAFYALIYFDLRVRKEGFDLMLLANRIDAGAAVAPPIAMIDRGEPGVPPGTWPPPPPPAEPPPPGGFLPPRPPE